MTDLRTAHAALVDAVTKIVPPRVSVRLSADDLDALAEHEREVRAVFDDYFDALAIEGNVSDARELIAAADTQRDHEDEVRADRRGWNKAFSTGVD